MTSNQNQEWRSNASLQRLPLIIDLLYGFAIGNGLSDALRYAVEHYSTVGLILLAAAMIMAVSDWLAYHVHVSPAPYVNIWRLLLDMTFPMLIYLLLLSPQLSQATSNGAFVSTVLLLYFGGAVLWLHQLSAETTQKDPRLEPRIKFCLSMCLVGATIGWLPIVAASERSDENFFYGLALAADGCSLVAIAVWSQYSITCVKETMMIRRDEEAKRVGRVRERHRIKRDGRSTA